MATNEKNILNRLYFVAGCMFIFVLAVVFKLCKIQFIDGDRYREMAEVRTVKRFDIPANRGNVYSADGSLLATSIPKYDIRIDAVQPNDKRFEDLVKSLSEALSKYTNKSVTFHENSLRKARKNNNRYFLLARNISYSDYIKFRNFPLLELGAIKGGLIVEQNTRREHPMGAIAERSIGYERIDDNGYATRVGLDGAFGEKYLRGENGKRLKQRIGNGKWKPIRDANEIEPKDGYDIYTTIDVNIQDIAHYALLDQLEKYKADHGCVVVMETKTGEIRAISNLGRNTKGKYYERLNYAVGESHEPGSTFKLMALTAALEDRVIDTSDVVDTEKGVLTYYNEKVRDSRAGGYGKISISEAFEVSSNTGIVKAIDNAYSHQPEKFVDRLYAMNLNKTLDLPLIGEGKPIIPDPRIKNNRWSGIALQWMAYGYGVSFTPLQTLAFYNAIANDGEMVKPRFLREVKEFDNVIVPFEREVINPKICSKQTVSKVKQLLKNVIEKKHGTGHNLYTLNFSMAGKTGTCQKDYNDKEKLGYISSFVGFFPADQPKYSCIVVIHGPDKSVGYYGADVSGPVFKKIAQKIYTDTPLVDELQLETFKDAIVDSDYIKYEELSRKYKTLMPNVVGMSAMDALALLENLEIKVKVKLKGSGKIKSQSVKRHVKLKTNQIIELDAS